MLLDTLSLLAQPKVSSALVLRKEKKGEATEQKTGILQASNTKVLFAFCDARFDEKPRSRGH